MPTHLSYMSMEQKLVLASLVPRHLSDSIKFSKSLEQRWEARDSQVTRFIPAFSSCCTFWLLSSYLRKIFQKCWNLRVASFNLNLDLQSWFFGSPHFPSLVFEISTRNMETSTGNFWTSMCWHSPTSQAWLSTFDGYSSLRTTKSSESRFPIRVRVLIFWFSDSFMCDWLFLTEVFPKFTLENSRNVGEISQFWIRILMRWDCQLSPFVIIKFPGYRTPVFWRFLELRTGHLG